MLLANEHLPEVREENLKTFDIYSHQQRRIPVFPFFATTDSWLDISLMRQTSLQLHRSSSHDSSTNGSPDLGPACSSLVIPSAFEQKSFFKESFTTAAYTILSSNSTLQAKLDASEIEINILLIKTSIFQIKLETLKRLNL